MHRPDSLGARFEVLEFIRDFYGRREGAALSLLLKGPVWTAQARRAWCSAAGSPRGRGGPSGDFVLSVDSVRPLRTYIFPGWSYGSDWAPLPDGSFALEGTIAPRPGISFLSPAGGRDPDPRRDGTKERQADDTPPLTPRGTPTSSGSASRAEVREKRILRWTMYTAERLRRISRRTPLRIALRGSGRHALRCRPRSGGNTRGCRIVPRCPGRGCHSRRRSGRGMDDEGSDAPFRRQRFSEHRNVPGGVLPGAECRDRTCGAPGARPGVRTHCTNAPGERTARRGAPRRRPVPSRSSQNRTSEEPGGRAVAEKSLPPLCAGIGQGTLSAVPARRAPFIATVLQARSPRRACIARALSPATSLRS